jgi:hypothetical protein
MLGALWLVLPAQKAMADRRTGVHVGVHVGVGGPVYRPFHPVYPYRYWYPGPGFYAGYYGPRVVEVRRVNYGSVDFNVDPQQSQVFVDGRYLGVADDFNGFPQTAKLPAGYHDVKIVSPDGRTVGRRIYVAAGEELNFNLNLR